MIGPPTVLIDSISIRVPGVERASGRRLGALVAENLASALRLAPGERSIEHLRLELASHPGEQPQELATRIAAELALLIANTSATEAGR